MRVFLDTLRSMARRIFALGFRGTFGEGSTESSGNLPSEVADEELLARFVFSRGHIRTSDSTLKPRAFEPERHPSTRNLELSVSRVDSLGEDAIWSIGAAIAVTRQCTLYARGEFTCALPKRVGLMVEPDEPPVRHAVIKGWPGTKNAWMSRAQEIAAEAKPVMAPKG